ncbi:MAG TPA: hypothetical protein VNJ04_12175, partial [Gemmatimonadaceae bacterium]|nr:hypothetical protein [Gemmatimonadaceae bacterium]
MVTFFPPVLIALDALLSRIKDAMRHADLSTEKAALYMHQDRAHLHRQLQGDGHLSAKRMADLPDETWRWLAIGLLDELGLPRELQRAARWQMAQMGRKRMA